MILELTWRRDYQVIIRPDGVFYQIGKGELVRLTNTPLERVRGVNRNFIMAFGRGNYELRVIFKGKSSSTNSYKLLIEEVRFLAESNARKQQEVDFHLENGKVTRATAIVTYNDFDRGEEL